jgi:hypothetical protein
MVQPTRMQLAADAGGRRRYRGYLERHYPAVVEVSKPPRLNLVAVRVSGRSTDIC